MGPPECVPSFLSFPPPPPCAHEVSNTRGSAAPGAERLSPSTAGAAGTHQRRLLRTRDINSTVLCREAGRAKWGEKVSDFSFFYLTCLQPSGKNSSQGGAGREALCWGCRRSLWPARPRGPAWVCASRTPAHPNIILLRKAVVPDTWDAS